VNTILPPLGSAQVPVILKEYDNSLIGSVGVGVVVGVIVLVGVFVGVCVKVGVTVGVCVLVGVLVGVGVRHGFALVQTTQSTYSMNETPIAEYVGPTPEYGITVAQPVKSKEPEILYAFPSIK
jgi:hypothetical protein